MFPTGTGMLGTGVATSTLTTALDSLFNIGLNAFLFVIQYSWPYIIVVAVIFFLIAIGKSLWHRWG